MRLLFSLSLWFCGLAATLLLHTPSAFGAEKLGATGLTPPRIAIWDPQISSVPDENGVDEINIDEDRLARIRTWLHNEKISVSMLRASDIRDTSTFNTEKFDAIFLPGDALVIWLVEPLRNFAQKGGVLVAINARNQPWSVPLVPDFNGRWVAQRNGKRMNELTDLFGTKWQNLAETNGAGAHYFSQTIQENLPLPIPAEGEAANTEPVIPPDYTKPVLRDFLPAPKVTAEAGTLLKPLIISQQSDTDKTQKTPQIFALQKENAKAIIVCNTVWSADFEEGGFIKAPQLWVTIAKISRDWKAGTLSIK
jgi:hypothetical protein